jgi:hypothetical protein
LLKAVDFDGDRLTQEQLKAIFEIFAIGDDRPVSKWWVRR